MFQVTSQSTESRRLRIRSVDFVDRAKGTTTASLTPDITNPFQPPLGGTSPHGGALLPPLDLPYTDYLVCVTIEIESDVGSDRYDLEFQLTPSYKEHWGFPLWDGLMGI